jgi:hypothetical protein
VCNLFLFMFFISDILHGVVITLRSVSQGIFLFLARPQRLDRLCSAPSPYPVKNKGSLHSSLKLTIHFRLVQSLRMSGAIPPFPHMLFMA